MCTWGSCTCQHWCAHVACATQAPLGPCAARSCCTGQRLCSTVLLHGSTPAHTQHPRGHALDTALHMRVPVSILTSCLSMCFRHIWTLVRVGLHTHAPWHMPWPSLSPPQQMHGLCPPSPAVAVATNGLKLGRGDGAAWVFFIYLCIISYLWLEAPASTLPVLWVLGWAQGLALVLQGGCWGDTRVSPWYGVPDPLMLFLLPTQTRCPRTHCSPSRTRG